MKEFNNIQLELSNGTGTLWLNRPDVHNAMNQEMIGEIIACVNEVNSMDEVRVLILRGQGKSFCAGADLNYMKSIATFGYEENFQDSMKLAQCFNTIYRCRKPTIAVVHGAAIGGANGLLSACDFVYCDDETKFAFSEVKLGIAPATISPYVIRRIGEYGCRDLMLTGRRFLGKEAERYRLVNASLPAADLEEKVSETVKFLMSSGPKAMSAVKDLLYMITEESSFDDTIEYTASLIAKLRASEEGQEGMSSFLEKRKPVWMEGGK